MTSTITNKKLLVSLSLVCLLLSPAYAIEGDWNYDYRRYGFASGTARYRYSFLHDGTGTYELESYQSSLKSIESKAEVFSRRFYHKEVKVGEQRVLLLYSPSTAQTNPSLSFYLVEKFNGDQILLKNWWDRRLLVRRNLNQKNTADHRWSTSRAGYSAKR